MLGQPARTRTAALPRILVTSGVASGGAMHDVFEVLEVSAGRIRARSAFLFEIGEELGIRLEHDGSVDELTARVRGHTGPEDARITELEVSERSAERPVED